MTSIISEDIGDSNENRTHIRCLVRRIIAVTILYKIEFKPVLPLNYTVICIMR